MASRGAQRRWGRGDKWGGLHEPPADEDDENDRDEDEFERGGEGVAGEGDDGGTSGPSSFGVSGQVVASKALQVGKSGDARFGQNPDLKGAFARDPGDVDVAPLLRSLKDVWGYDGFRAGQEEAVRRVLSGRSTLLVSATGSGKSLCYVLPALKLPGITIVISPLIALIKDQLANLPGCVPGAALHSMMSQKELHDTIARTQAGQVKVLFLSPERIFADGFVQLAATFPPINFACVDEVMSKISRPFPRLSSQSLTRRLAHPQPRIACAVF